MFLSEYSEMYTDETEERSAGVVPDKKPEETSNPLVFILEDDASEKIILMGISVFVSTVIGCFFYYILYSPWWMPPWMFFIFGADHPHLDGNVAGAINEVSFTGLPVDLSHRLEVGWNIGAACALLVDGDEMINVAGGGKYHAGDHDYKIDTLQVIFSSGKVLESIGMAVLHDKGLIDIRNPVAKYWPEFGTNGKETITIEDILSHRSGLGLSFNTLPTIETLHDPKLLATFLEQQHPIAPPGTVMYSGWFSALYLDQIVRRVDPQKRSLLTMIQQDILKDLPNAEVYAGDVPESAKERISPIYEMPSLFWLFGFLPQLKLPDWFVHTLFYDDSRMTMTKEEKHMIREMMNHKEPFHNLTIPFMHIYEGVDEFNSHDTFLGFESISVNAISNSHSMALILESFAHGGLVSESTLNYFTERLPREFDNFIGMNMTHTRGGFALLHTLFPEHAFQEEKHSKSCIGWAGLLVGGGGGSLVATCVVEDHNVTFAYTSNQLNGRMHDWRSTELLDLAISAVRHKKFADFFDDTHAFFKDNHETRDDYTHPLHKKDE